MATSPSLTTEQRANLAKLAAYLRTLPVKYRKFDMRTFAADGDNEVAHHNCGAVACAVGHGPVAGVARLVEENWFDYADRAFGHAAWEWCFSSFWRNTDNTAHGAAARIEWLLEKGVPNDAGHQMNGAAPLCYRATQPTLQGRGDGRRAY